VANRMLVFILIYAGIASAASGNYNFPPNGRYVLPVTLGKALLHPCSRSVPKTVTGFWEPTEADIDNLEKQLVNYVAGLERAESLRPPAESYDRQYVGIYVGGAKLIYGNYFPPAFSKYRPRSKPIDVCDGGPRHWGVVFHPKTNSFTNLSFSNLG